MRISRSLNPLRWIGEVEEALHLGGFPAQCIASREIGGPQFSPFSSISRKEKFSLQTEMRLDSDMKGEREKLARLADGRSRGGNAG